MKLSDVLWLGGAYIVIALIVALTYNHEGTMEDRVRECEQDTVYVKVVNVPAPPPVEVQYATRFDISPKLAKKIVFYADRHEIDRDMAHGLVYVESSFNPDAVSHAGARGLTQLMRPTAGEYLPNPTDSLLHDVDTNLDVGFRYLRYLLDRFDENEYVALAAYNAGPGRINQQGVEPYLPYARKVISSAEMGK